MTTPKEALELKPCPFCGRTNTHAADTGVYWVACNSCDAEGPIRDTEHEAIVAWNTRATASLQGEDAVERVALAWAKARNEWMRASRHGTQEEADKAAVAAILATGLVPDEAAIRADEREKCETGAIHDIAAERKRQREVEGWTLEHDDGHDRGELAAAAACYAVGRCIVEGSVRISERRLTKNLWPWSLKWWKPKGRRRNLVRAATLIVAEIERIDRAAAIRSGGGE